MMIRRALLLLAISAGNLQAEGARAATVSDTMTASINLPVTCSISASSSLLDFGTKSVTSSAVPATEAQMSGITVQCSNGSSVAVHAASLNASGGQFRLRSGSNYLNYTIYTDAARSTPWAQSSGASGATVIGTGLGQSFALYGRIPAQAAVAVGTYTDTITITVSY